MATDFNITMKQYNGVDYDALYPETKGSQIITPVPIASGGTNSNTASGAMNNLITALSTITPANNDLIPFKDVSGNTSGVVTVDTLATLAANKGAKIQTGSYVGTGTYGSSNPCSLTFDFVPQFVLIGNGSQIFNMWTKYLSIDNPEPSPVGLTRYMFSGSTYYNSNYPTLSNTTLSWYSSKGETNQLNENGIKYSYVSIG